MSSLPNPDHERFCQDVHRRILNREKVGEARTAAYREHIYQGKGPDTFVADNARRLAQQKHIKERIAELADLAFHLAGVDASRIMVELWKDAQALKSFNLDDYLSAPDAEGNRYYDLGKVSREQMGLLAEMTIESSTIVGTEKDGAPPRTTHKIKLGGPKLFAERRAIFALMADIGGWKAPVKAEVTSTSLEALILQSFKVDDAAE